MKITCGELAGVILLAVAFLSTIISIAMPYWAGEKIGLVYKCEDECEWYFMKEDLPDWFKATQGLMVAGLGLELIAFVVTLVSLSCTYHDCDPHRPISILVLIAFLCLTTAIILFGVKAHEGEEIDPENFYESYSLEESTDNVVSVEGTPDYASYWAAVVAAVAAFLTSGTFCFIDRRHMD